MTDRHDIESHGQLILAALSRGRFIRAHGEGVSDSAMGRTYAYGRSSISDRADYALGWHLGRFLISAGLPLWRAPVTVAHAGDWLARFLGSHEGRAYQAVYGPPLQLSAGEAGQ